MGKWCLQASTFIFYQIFIKLANNLDKHKLLDGFEFGLSGLFTLELPALIAEKTIFDLLAMLNSGEQSLLFGRLVISNCPSSMW